MAIQPVVIKNKNFRSISEAARYYNFTQKTIEGRLRRGLTLEEALDLEPPKTHKAYNLWLRRTGKEERVCSRCKIQKSLSDYYPKPDGQTGTHGSQCKKCVKKQVLESHRRRSYGLTPQMWNDLFISQDSRCKICKIKEINHEWHTDHCHKTNKVRGILCKDCNLMIGFAKDNIKTLKKAIEYLRWNGQLNSLMKEDCI